MMVVVVRVSRVEMYSNVNLHLKRLAVTHLGGDWSFSGILALSVFLGKMKVEMEEKCSLKVTGAARREGAGTALLS